ncbi:aminoacyl-tRNA hydrolase [Treponema sp.]|uniref:aminoacyl-tRNA hydrolase n=1 Tax=Treponema sp. TaxID=166 RepID=UPI00388DD644
MISVVAFLGNYGNEYKNTRHNAAWLFAGTLPFYSRLNFLSKFDGELASLDYSEFVNLVSNSYPELCKDDGQIAVPKNAPAKIYFLKPQTYMNLSGQSIGQLCKFYKIKPEEVLVVHDELELKNGFFSLKWSGGLAGHNGLRSTKDALGTADFWRLRFGIGKPADINIADYVLSNFTKDEMPLMETVFKKAGVLLVKALLSSDPSRLLTQWGKVNVNA